MLLNRIIATASAIGLVICMSAQIPDQDHRHWADSIIEAVIQNRSISNRFKSDFLDSIYQVFDLQGDVCNQARARVIQAGALDNMGMPDSALAQLYWALAAFNESCDSTVLMSLYTNLTNVLLSLGEFDRVDSIGEIANDLWVPPWRKDDSRYAILNNLAIGWAMRGELDTATTLFKRAYSAAAVGNDTSYILRALNNLGSIKGMQEDLDSAYFFLAEAASVAGHSNDTYTLVPLLVNLATLNLQRERYGEAQTLLDSAYALADTNVMIEFIADITNVRADLFAAQNDYRRAYELLTDYVDLRERFLDEERVKAVTEMMEKYESERKARQIQQLEIDKLDANLENERIRHARNRLFFLGGLIALIAITLWSRLRIVRRSRAAIRKEKEVSEGLLLNILPASVASELKEYGYTDARHFENATILFSDFQDFTRIAGQLSASELVDEINTCFKAFDEIMTEYGVEKVKTIGDAYMAAVGVTETDSATAAQIVSAGLAMQAFMKEHNRARTAAKSLAFEMRVGVHSGPVVAGIVGIKKFQYDLWGDTVNIASRMESRGQVNRVNISEATYELVRDDPGFNFIARGFIEAKGKGPLQMWFVENGETRSDDNQDRT